MTKSEALEYINGLPEESNIEITVMDKIVSSGEIEKMGISRQLLRYYVREGYVRTVHYGKQKRYLLDDLLRVRGNK